MFTIKLADQIIVVEHHYPYVEQFCRNYWVPPTQPDFTVSITQEEIEQEYLDNGGTFERPHCENICVHRQISLKLLDYDTFIVHAAVVQVDGRAYGFTAHSGTGKSTHVGLWLQHFGQRASVVNGDKPMIGYRDGKFYVYGTPWQGKEGLGENTCVPFCGLALLERSQENFIRKAQSEDIVRSIFDQILVPKTPLALAKQMKLLNLLIEHVPIYRLGCNLSPEAAVIASQQMCEENNED